MKSFLPCVALGLLLLAPASALAQTPTVTAISDLSLNAGGTRTIPVVAYSANTSSSITLTASLPAFATLNAPTSGTGLVSTTIALAPTAGDAGTYNASVTATSGSSSTTENFVITVNAAGSNEAPVVSAPAVQNATTGTMLTFTVNAVSVQTITALSATNLPSGATFTPNGTNTSGTFSWTPTAGQTGDYDVTFIGTNATGQGSSATHIHVSGVCTNAPVLTAPASRTVNEGQALAFTVTSTDADGDHVTLTAGTLPEGASVSDQGNNTLNFSWQPNFNQSGTYTITFYGSDGKCNQVSATTVITVNDVSGSCVNAPVLTAPSTRTVTEGQALTFSVSATDADGDHVTLTTGTLPSGALATDQGNNTLNFSWTPSTSQSGTYIVTFYGSDGKCNQVSAITTITVNDSGTGGGCVHAPVLTAPSSRTVTEGQTLAFTVTATDADGDHVTLTAGTLPSGASVSDQGNNSLNFSWQPNTSQAGTYTITFFGSDGKCNQVSATTTITVNDSGAGGSCVNPPTLNAPATRTVTEGQTISFTVTGSDADGDHVTLGSGSLPSGATTQDQGNNTLTFNWTPSTSQAGTYTVRFFGNDGKCNEVSVTTTITVLDSNGGGGGNGQANIVLIGQINTHNDRTCFRITPVNSSFDLRDVDLTSFTLQFNGTVVHALSGRVQLETDCEGDHDGGGDCDNDAARLNLGGGHGHGDNEQGDDDGDDDCDECHNDCNDCNNDTCDAVAIRACFSTRDLMNLFCNSIRDSLDDATIHFTLNNGTEIVATFTGSVAVHGKGKGHGLHAMAKPNPLNPSTKLSFTLNQGGRVQVSVYDPQGRLVRKLVDREMVAGNQTVDWDGSNSRNGRVSSGVYFFRIQAPEGQEVKRVAVVK